MSRWNTKKKKWHDYHCQKNQKRKKRVFSSVSDSENRVDTKKKTEINKKYVSVSFDVPSIFSLVNNAEETIAFFDKLIEEINHKQYGKRFYINSINVESVTVDALIYLIAIMENIKVNKYMHYQYEGNFPKSIEARKIYQESGFMSYVSSKIKRLPKNTEKMQIISGIRNDPVVAKTFCNFVMGKLNKSRVDVKNLQVVFIELMSNVFHHAYIDDDVMSKHWYIYAEHIEDFIRFIFVDTGVGIANTVRVNFKEKIMRMMKWGANDGDLLKSTFQGDFRTQTQENNRGNGLSAVREQVINGPFKRFEVISGRGYCAINKNIAENQCLKINNYSRSIYGTVYTFDVY